jgi:hypothetical protein
MDVIAERTLKFLKHGTTEPEAVVIRIGRPEFIHERDAWATPYEIVEPGEATRSFRLYGPDSMQSMLYVIYIIPSYLAIMAGRGKLSWDGDEDLGFLPPLGSRADGAACSVGESEPSKPTT